ncbi:ATP-binding protein [Paenibacillus sp.]|uniref:ATP-binding protein n=1 Tax=Paenibacillus sp. TaxID=58172 RepID=UPI00281204A6|nr:ATP-binding protein [Paenibacillus sp.]
MNNLTSILLNVMLTAFPFLVIQTFSQRLPFHRTGPLAIGFFMGVPLVGCMFFPYTYGHGLTYDLKFIPLIAGTLYGGWPVGLGLSLVSAAAGYYIAEAYWLEELAVATLTASLVAAARAKFFAASWLKKILWASVFSVATVAMTLAGVAMLGETLPIDAALLFAAVQTGLLLMTLALGEHIRETDSVRTEIARMEKLTVSGSLAVLIAHELRNPLTTVNGFLQLIKRQHPSEQILYYVNTAMQELSEAEKIIHTYLTITTLKEAEKKHVSLSAGIDGALRDIWPVIEAKKIDLVNAVSDDITLYCNEEQLRLCLMHLLRNGANALHRGGRLTVSSYWKGKELAIVVSDNGVGMTEEQLEQLGMPKYNTRSSGTGTGLMYCFHFVHSLQGRLRIQSQPGRGTTVTVTVPALRTT